MPTMDEREELLLGGNVSGRVVKIGRTVRKPSTPATPSVVAFLRHLHAEGFRGSPRSLGSDEQGRQVLEYIPGTSGRADVPLPVAELTMVGALIRELHEVAARFRMAPDARWDTPWKAAMKPDAEEIVCHNDLAPWNLIRDGARWVFIDWDNAAPGTRLWDLAYAAVTFLPIETNGSPEAEIPRLRAIAAGYGLDRVGRERLPLLMHRRAQAMHDLLVEGGRSGQQPWARLYADGHAAYWGGAARYLEGQLLRFEGALLS